MAEAISSMNRAQAGYQAALGATATHHSRLVAGLPEMTERLTAAAAPEDVVHRIETRFGTFEVDDKSLIVFGEGLPGLRAEPPVRAAVVRRARAASRTARRGWPGRVVSRRRSAHGPTDVSHGASQRATC
jgi:uncharacterized protein YigA (DUF484 family)